MEKSNEVTFTQAELDAIVAAAVRKTKIDCYHLALKCQNDAFSRGSFRVVMHNLLLEELGIPRA